MDFHQIIQNQLQKACFELFQVDIDQFELQETRKDFEGDFSTTTIGGKECAFAIYDEKKVLKCGIEQAYLDGKTKFKKPISCHLYPIRITKYDHYEALNYDRWSICSAACSLGAKLGVPIYKFLKEALIRKYGEAWYEELCEDIEGR